MSGALRKHAAQIESLEPRTLMSSQPVAAPLSAPIDFDELPEVFPTLTDAHRLTGWDSARNDYGFDGRGQTVAVIDSGIGYDHPALGGGFGSGARVVGGWDFAEGDANPYDDGPSGSHGTHVAGIIGSSHSVNTGVAPGVDLVALRVFTDTGSGNFAWVEQALRWVHQNKNAFANPITTVNLSLGTTWNSDSIPNWANLEEEFQQLNTDGIFVSVSAGNSFTRYNAPGLSYPAASSYVVPVASVDDDGQLSSFSQRSQRVIAAPGQSIMSTVPDYRGNQNGKPDDFLRFSGTSMAAPYVAGASAVIRQALGFLGQSAVTQQTIYDWMRNTADTIHDGATNLDYARLDLRQALDAIMPADDFGSDALAAHDLGAIRNTSIAGLIGKLSDRDFFRFTAQVSGTVTVSANLTNGAVANWQVTGADVNASASGATFRFHVTAGQSYTVGLGAGNLGFYNVSFATQASRASMPFDEAYYLMRYGDVRAAVQAGYFSSGREHFESYGKYEGRSPFVTYNEASYLAANPDVKNAVQHGWLASGAAHYAAYGWFEGRNPSDLFDETYYLDRYADVRGAVEQGAFSSGLEHYLQFGQYEGRSPSALFDGNFYLSRNADVLAAANLGWFHSGIEHFVLYGRAEGRVGSQTVLSQQFGGPLQVPLGTSGMDVTPLATQSLLPLEVEGDFSSDLAWSVQLSSSDQYQPTSMLSTDQSLDRVLDEASESVRQELKAVVPQLSSYGTSGVAPPFSSPGDQPEQDDDAADPWLSFQQRELIDRVDELFASLNGD
jgi:subtilisin family serine protease